jgi:hypothetical protein
VDHLHGFLAIESTCRKSDAFEEILDIPKKNHPAEAEMKQFKLFLKWIKKERNIDYKPSYYAYPYFA